MHLIHPPCGQCVPFRPLKGGLRPCFHLNAPDLSPVVSLLWHHSHVVKGFDPNKQLVQKGAEQFLRLSHCFFFFKSMLSMEYCVKGRAILEATIWSHWYLEQESEMEREWNRRGNWKATSRKRNTGWHLPKINVWADRHRQQRWDRATPVGKRTRFDGGERQTEKSGAFSSVAQRWLGLRAAASVQFSVPLQHSEPLSLWFSEELRAAPAGPLSARFSHVPHSQSGTEGYSREFRACFFCSPFPK